MDVKRLSRTLKKIKPLLVFFCLVTLLTACQQDIGFHNIKVNYNNGVAISVSFESKSDPTQINFYVSGEIDTPILGEIGKSEKGYEFTPAIPFRPGQTYEIRNGAHKPDSFTILAATGDHRPRVVRMYPSTDSVPENLLKIYLQFSMPMQEVGNALDFIRVRNESDGQPVEIFLRLESELWNKEHDLLTLWLDPGRIKTGLIPNNTRGLPLTAGLTYSIHIADEWKSASGQLLEEPYEKIYHVGEKDLAKPDPNNWGLHVPFVNSRIPLQLAFPESLDAILLPESLYVRDEKGKPIEGAFRLGSQERSLDFYPANNWGKGNYIILIDPKLEDMAGNSLSRLFDEELHRGNLVPRDFQPKQLAFTIN